MRTQIWISTIACLLFILAHTSTVWALSPPLYGSGVNDYGDVLSDEYENTLGTELIKIANESHGYELAIITIPTKLAENGAQAIFDSWKVGKDNPDKSVVLIIDVDKKQASLITGSEAANVITAEEATTIIGERLTPALNNDQFEQGIEACVDAIQKQLEDEQFATVPPINQSPAFLQRFFSTLTITILFIAGTLAAIYWTARMSERAHWWVPGVIGASLGFLIGNTLAVIFFGMLGLVVGYMLTHKK